MKIIKPKFLERLSERDRKILTGLTVFLVFAAWYQFLFEPIYSKWRESSRTLLKTKQELLKMQKKISQRGRLEREKEGILSDLSELSAKINQSLLSPKLPEKINAIMKASREASVEVTNLRPLSGSEAEKGRKIETFTMEGNTRAGDFVNFIDRLWGMKIEELSLSLTETKERPIKFYAKLSSISPENIKILNRENKKKVKITHFSLSDNPFEARKAPQPVIKIHSAKGTVADMPGVEGPPPPPTIDLSGLRLVGIAAIGSKNTAVVMDDRMKGESFLSVGDAFRDYSVYAVDDTSITFRNKEGITGRLELPLLKDIIQAGGPERASPESRKTIPVETKKGRLGITLRALTSEIAKEKGFSVQEGLLVVSNRKDETGIRIDDVVLKMNGIKTASVNDAQRIMQTVKPGDQVEMEIIREKETMTVKIKAIE